MADVSPSALGILSSEEQSRRLARLAVGMDERKFAELIEIIQLLDSQTREDLLDFLRERREDAIVRRKLIRFLLILRWVGFGTGGGLLVAYWKDIVGAVHWLDGFISR